MSRQNPLREYTYPSQVSKNTPLKECKYPSQASRQTPPKGQIYPSELSKMIFLKRGLVLNITFLRPKYTHPSERCTCGVASERGIIQNTDLHFDHHGV